MVSPQGADAGQAIQSQRGRLPQLAMQHAFLLFVYLGMGDGKKLVSNDLYFRDLNDCLWYAQKLHKQGEDITAYCLPKLIVGSDVKVY